MSDSTTLTRCPHCQTRFRVTEQQLGVAAGKVRCGNCMEVFNARDNAVASPGSSQPATPPVPPKTPSRETPPQQQTGAADDDEFLFQDNPEEDALDGHYTQSFKADDDLSDSFLALDQGSKFDSTTDEVEHIGEVDESWAEEMLHDTERQESRARREQAASASDRKPAPKAPSEPRAEPAPKSHPEAPSEPAVNPNRPEPRPEPEAAAAPNPALSPLEELSLSVEADDVRYSDPDNGGKETRKAAKSERKPTAPKNPYSDLRSQPVAAGGSGRGWGAKLLWLLGSLALLGLIFAQLFVFQFDRLSRYEPLRPLYAAACPLIGCELPEMVDTDQIESRKLVVRSHPDEPKALLVEALIVNQAPFEQPFPAIVLTFSNLNNDVVAQRAFKPSEYLQGEAQDMTSIPPNTPVKIALELQDPGQDAVNYNLRFLPMPQENP